MLVLDDGTYLGGISGGCLEGDALRRAQKGIAHNRPSIITYDTTQEDDYQVGVGLGCEGVIDVLFTPLYPQKEDNPLVILSGLTAIREPAIVITVTGCTDEYALLGSTFLYEKKDSFLRGFTVNSIAGPLLQDIKKCGTDSSSRTITYDVPGGEMQIFIEVVLPATHIAVFGGNYDIYPLVRMANELGWDTTVVMNITKANKSLLSDTTRLLDNRAGKLPMIDPYTAVLLMSHDYRTDFQNLQNLIHSKASYIGLLGPRKRSDKIFRTLATEGNPVPEESKQRIYSPAGLDIGADTPEEIALSILSEIRSHFGHREGMSLRLREGTIYDKPA
jgi:xanthine/CO dehydrogenase XdhC/CoxF family maturation factor